MSDTIEGKDAIQDIPGMTYRKFDHWCRKGYIHCARLHEETTILGPIGHKGSGNRRIITQDEIRVLTVMTELVTLGFNPAAAAFVARALDSGITKFGSLSLRIERAS